MRNLVYFSANFPLNFIEKCWEDNPGLAKHIRCKLLAISDKENLSYISLNAFYRFFFDLDASNQAKLCEWIIKNYNGIP